MKLLGFPASNYYQAVAIALLEKNLHFEEVRYYPKTSDYLAKSPMGKVPCLQTDEGYLTETQVILDFLEESHPGTRLYPADPFARAKVRELMKIIELYLEWPARRLYPATFFGAKAVERDVKEVEVALDKGFDALTRVLHVCTFALGDTFTYADIYLACHLPLIKKVAATFYGKDYVADIPELEALLSRLEQRPSIRQLKQDSESSMAEFLHYIKERYPSLSNA